MSESAIQQAVLVVEDEPLISDLIQSALEDAGFAVLMAADDEAAIALLEANEALDLVALVTDVNLGRPLTGWDVAKCARQLNPTLPVVYTTGDSAHDWASHGVPHSSIIMKPFAPAQIVVALSTLINAAGSDVG